MSVRRRPPVRRRTPGVILAALTLALGELASDVVVATTNVDHISRYAPAQLRWRLGGSDDIDDAD